MGRGLERRGGQRRSSKGISPTGVGDDQQPTEIEGCCMAFGRLSVKVPAEKLEETAGIWGLAKT